MLSATDLSLSYGGQTILDGVNLTLEARARIGLVGANGSGKTSLLRILAREIHPEAGSVTLGRDLTLAYLSQQKPGAAAQTVYELAEEGFAREHALLKERLSYAAILEQDPGDERALAEVARIDETLEAREYFRRDGRITRVLSGLGFSPEEIRRPLSQFSGGWQMRAALARTLLTRADFLLLDEPTNYLDSETRQWLSRFIAGYEGGVMLVSHDRAFLDDTIEVVLELFLGRLRRYRGSYSTYERRRREELQQLIRAWELQQRDLKRQEDFIRRFRATASKAKQVKSRVRALEKSERIEIPPHIRPVHITLPPAPHSGRIALELDGVTKRYGERVVLEGLELTIGRGQRLAVVGLNGAGKSTLLRTLAGVEAPTAGQIVAGSGVLTAYYAQDSSDTLPDGETVEEYITKRASSDALPRVRDILGAFLFDEEGVAKPLDVLSGGERSRLVMAGLLTQPANLLILDEPTNHLDMTSQEVLAHALADYDGTVVFVSHDRDFLRHVATDVLALWPEGVPRPDKGWRSYPGTFREFETSHWGGVFSSAETNEETRHGRSTRPWRNAGTTDADDDAKRAYHTQKASRAELKKAERLEASLLERLDELEEDHRRIQEAMAEEENYTDPQRIRALTAQLAVNEAAQHDTTSEWERVSARLEELQNSSR
ncbi:MAG: ATP-binding cassette domain-containing protein [Spirochaetales bacterium]|nr:ATP-binding cassette domain-containing protein [Spirochaetales bacterium]